MGTNLLYPPEFAAAPTFRPRQQVKRPMTARSGRNVAKSPEILQIRGVYAGSGFSASPSPRALPLPSFFSRGRDREGTIGDCDRDRDRFAAATSDLRRMLRLDQREEER